MGATVEAEAALAYVETLLRGSDAAVRAMTDRQCRTAIAALQQRLLAEDDDVVRVVYERQLARGLLRWGGEQEVVLKIQKHSTTGLLQGVPPADRQMPDREL